MKRFFVLLPAVFLLGACGLFRQTKKPEKKKENPNVPQLVGRIASVPLDKRFVLVQSYGVVNFDAGAIFTSRGPGERSANLRVTGEKLGQFLAADIQAGAAEVGDAVYSHHTPKPKTEGIPPLETGKIIPPAEAGADAPALPEAENSGNQ